jgi:hypothetical protein
MCRRLTRAGSAVQFEVTYSGKNASAMNWGGWSQEAIDHMSVALRMMDDTLLFGRVGYR